MKINYIPSLDGIRAISVFLVLFSHAGLGHILPGGLGVTTFFFLSGFLITTLLMSEYTRNNQINFKYFFLRRFYRLFPPLAITLLVAYLLCFSGLLGGGISWQGLLAQIFYLANYHVIFSWIGDIPNGTGVLWSLAVEEHFYLFFPILLYFALAKLSKVNIVVMLASLCLIVLCWRIYLVFIEHAAHIHTYYSTDTRVDSILYGCIMALIWNPIDKAKLEKFDGKAWALMLAAVLLLLASLLIRGDVFRETLRYSIQGLALIPIFYYSIRCSEHWLFHWLNWSWMRKLGVYSYFIYLIHLVVIRFLEYNNITHSILLVIVLSSIISIAFAFVVDKYIDVHFASLRRKYRS